jgi:bifunctional DNase/RNase
MSTSNMSRCSRAILAVALAAVIAACTKESPSEVKVLVRGIQIDASSRPLVLLEDEERELGLPIWIGAAEAQAIAMEMEGVLPERPLTHDLFKKTLDIAGVGFDKVVIDTLREGTYYARIHLTVDGDHREVDSRPSDAIALALRFDKPVYVAPSLFESETAIDLHGVKPVQDVAHEAGVTVQNVTPELAAYFELAPGEGVLVADVDEAIADLKRGDVILEIDGVAVASAQDFRKRIQGLYSARGARLSVLRDGDRLGVDLHSPTR